MKLEFPPPFSHRHPPVQNASNLFDEQTTLGQRAADKVARLMGSWPFILTQTFLLLLWVMLNVLALISHWDPYPFILLNLVLSLQAAFTAPIIMMSQNRQSEKDRIEAHNDFVINTKAEEEIRAILEHLHAQDKALQEIYRLLDEIHANRAAELKPDQ